MNVLAIASAVSLALVTSWAGSAHALLSCDLSAGEQEQAVALINDYIEGRIEKTTLLEDLAAIAPLECFESTAIDHPIGEQGLLAPSSPPGA